MKWKRKSVWLISYNWCNGYHGGYEYGYMYMENSTWIRFFLEHKIAVITLGLFIIFF